MARRSTSSKPRAREVLNAPAYTIGEAAHHLRLPVATARSWLMGRPYQTGAGRRRFEPLIEIADQKKAMLSFRNLVELHVLSAIRREHQVRLPVVRAAIDYLKKRLQSPHPLADQQMSTDGIDLFVEHYGKLINASRQGQTAMKAVLGDFLERIERDPRGVAIRLYPFSGRQETRVVVIDPAVRFGRPCLRDTGIPTDVIVDRFDAGDTIAEIAQDYGCEARQIEEAIRFERSAA